MYAFEGDRNRKDFEVNPLLNSKSVDIWKVMRDVRTRTKVIKDWSKSKVLNTLEHCKIGGGAIPNMCDPHCSSFLSRLGNKHYYTLHIM